MTIEVAFFVALVATVGLMLGALVAGLRRWRRLHLWLGPLTLVGLAVAVVLALRLGQAWQFPPDAMRIHRVFAITAAGSAVLVGVTGVLLLRRPAVRRWHRRAVAVFVLTALCATGTGFWIWTGAVPR